MKLKTVAGGDTDTGAFTLVEMLVTIAVIAILAALLFPAITGVREKANDTKCVSNLRQMGAGLMLYVADHDGALIPGAVASQEGGLTLWFNALDAYMGNQEEGNLSNFASGRRPAWQRCPSKVFKETEMDHFSVGYGWNYYGDNAGHDGFGLYPGDYNADGSSSGGHGGSSRLAEVTKPAKTIIIADSKDIDVAPSATHQNIYLYPPPATGQRASRHSGRGNYLMVDGHVESLPPDLEGYTSYFIKAQ